MLGRDPSPLEGAAESRAAEEGPLEEDESDAQGRTVDFKNTVVIMTSNLGADRIQQHARTKEPFEELRDDLMQILRQSFRPEFINRITRSSSSER